MKNHIRETEFVAICNDLWRERIYQDKTWKRQDHDPFLWITILTEEVGEAAQAALRLAFEGHPETNLRAELVQVAAVAINMIGCLDRGEWNWGQAKFGGVVKKLGKPIGLPDGDNDG